MLKSVDYKELLGELGVEEDSVLRRKLKLNNKNKKKGKQPKKVDPYFRVY